MDRATYSDLKALQNPDQLFDTNTSATLGHKGAIADAEASLLDDTSRMRKKVKWISTKSWHILLNSGVLAGLLVFGINVAALAVVYTHFDIQNDVAFIWAGNCNQAGNIVTGAHLIINVLGSLLLAASNTGMQCLSSPSRAEVDAAHRQKSAFFIGVRSFRNVCRVSKTKTCLWLLLAVSSLPLHLLWNSVVFQTLATNNYYAMSVTDGFAKGAKWIPFQDGTVSWELNDINDSIVDMQKLANTSRLERLSRSQCIRSYGQELVVGRRNVLMVTNSSGVIDLPSPDPTPFNITSSLLALYAAAITPNATAASAKDLPTYSWMCIPPQDGYDFCDLAYVEYLASHDHIPWIPGYTAQAFGSLYVCGDFGNGNVACGVQGNAEVLYCLSEQVSAPCKVGLIPVFLIVVCVCTAAKLLAFVCTIRFTVNKGLLVTQGDAIESFLANPDPLLRGMCLATWRDFRYDSYTCKTPGWDEKSKLRNGQSTETALKVDNSRYQIIRPNKHSRWRWWTAAQGLRWTIAYVLVLAFLVAAAIIFTKTRGTDYNGRLGRKAIWDGISSQGLDQPIPNFLLSTGQIPLLAAFVLANLPQFLWSYLYLEINGLLTSVLGMAEWTSYYAARKAKGLRVSNPIAGSSQRTTPFLTLPFRWGLPPLIIFMVLHWLTSEMLFVAKVETYSFKGELDLTTSLTGIYYSPLVAICLACIGGSALLVLLLVVNCKHFPRGAPRAGNCSASIAAACQPPPGEGSFKKDLAQQKLRWGVVTVPHGSTHVGHATFSDGPVGVLLPDMRYI